MKTHTLYYTEFGLSHLEVTGERCLSIYLSGCRNNCPDCHYPDLRRTDCGLPLGAFFPQMLDLYRKQATCVCFLGEGEDTEETRRELTRYADIAHGSGLKTCLYPGRDTGIEPWMRCFDYIKVGSYRKERGPLRAPTTNQRLFRASAGGYEDITALFRR